jgi:hypothetical protein
MIKIDYVNSALCQKSTLKKKHKYFSAKMRQLRNR